MNCAKCEGKGYIETLMAVSARYVPQVKQCPVCQDVTAYTKRVQELRNKELPKKPVDPPKNPTGPGVVLPFVRR